ncbi:hypothetical protein EON65_51105, partial [archaeon]
ALGADCILDGELVYNITLKKSVYMIFDILMYRGEVVVLKPFVERLSLIRDVLYPAYKLAIQSLQNTPRLSLLMKRFVKKADLPRLLSFVSEKGGERVYMDNEDRHHYTDGLIFQPNVRYN